MEESFFNPVTIAAILGFIPVAVGLWLGRRNQKAQALLNEGQATKAIYDSYAALTAALETRMANLERSYQELCDEKEKNEDKWAKERQEMMEEIERQKAACEERFQELLAENKSLLNRIRELESKEERHGKHFNNGNG